MDKQYRITREEAIQILSTRDAHGVLCGYTSGVTEALHMAIEALSPEAVQGEWVRKYDDKVNCYWYECDQCGEYRPRNQFGHEYNANFCPNCGAKMTKGGDDE